MKNAPGGLAATRRWWLVAAFWASASVPAAPVGGGASAVVPGPPKAGAQVPAAMTDKPAHAAARGVKPLPIGCVIEPAQTAEVSAPTTGVLEAVLVDRGDRVQRGQLIATLQSQVEHAALQTARARAASQSEMAALASARDLARTKLKRMHALAQLESGGRLELENAAAEFEIAEHRLQQAREALTVAQREADAARAQWEMRRIRSPIDGVVADRLLHAGERVDGRPIVRVLTLHRLKVEVVLPAKRLHEIKEGARATVIPEGIDAPEVNAKVVQVDRFVDPASGTFRARLSVLNAAGAVPPGARCRVDFAPPAEGGAPAAADQLEAPPLSPVSAPSVKPRAAGPVKRAGTALASGVHGARPSLRGGSESEDALPQVFAKKARPGRALDAEENPLPERHAVAPMLPVEAATRASLSTD